MRPNKAPAAFVTPEDAPVYIGAIVERCEDLINHSVWSGLHISQFRRWLANFKTDEERYFAACVLDALVYRSRDQTISLMKHLFQRVLPDLIRADSTVGAVANLSSLRQPRSYGDPGVRLVPVVRKDDSPTKSGHIVARLLRQYLSIDESWIINPGKISSAVNAGVSSFIFVDDFLGTGEQFDKFARNHDLAKRLSSSYAAYTPLVGHIEGVKALAESWPGIRVRPVELLDATHSLFHADSPCFIDERNTPESAKAFYYRLLRRRRIKIPSQARLGYGRLQLAYAFEHAIPDSCLPILWCESSGWHPLFKR